MNSIKVRFFIKGQTNSIDCSFFTRRDALKYFWEKTPYGTKMFWL